MRPVPGKTGGLFSWARGAPPRAGPCNSARRHDDLNATYAAKRAGYAPRSASTTGYRLLQRPAVAAAVAKAQRKRAARTRVSADRVVTELAKVAFGDPRRLLSWG
jgi:hypothetical protein